MRADKRRYLKATEHDDAPSRRRSAWLIIAAAVISVVSLALGALQLQSVQRAIGIPLPEMMVGGYDADYVEAVRDLLDAAVIERYQSVHYLWFLLFPVAFAALIILLVRRFSPRKVAFNWRFHSCKTMAMRQRRPTAAPGLAFPPAVDDQGERDSEHPHVLRDGRPLLAGTNGIILGHSRSAEVHREQTAGERGQTQPHQAAGNERHQKRGA